MRTRVQLRSALGVVALVASLAAPARARAQAEARVDLTYERGEATGSCPDARAFAAAVAGRLGYEPFQAGAARRVSVVLDRRERTFEARIELVGAGGAPAERRFTSRAGDCAELAATTELAVAIAIDPFRAAAPEPPPAEPPPPPRDPVLAAPPPPPVAPVVVLPPLPRPKPGPPAPPLVAEVAAAVVGGIGSAPTAAVGVEVRIGARRGDLSLALEGRADLPASTTLAAGDVSASLLVASLVPCAHWRSFAACALATAGVLRAAGHGLVDARQTTDPWVALGVRLAADLPLHGRLSLTAHADAVAPLVETELKVSGAVVWSTPALAFSAGLGLAIAFR
jgi:hypothetical protein